MDLAQLAAADRVVRRIETRRKLEDYERARAAFLGGKQAKAYLERVTKELPGGEESKVAESRRKLAEFAKEQKVQRVGRSR